MIRGSVMCVQLIAEFVAASHVFCSVILATRIQVTLFIPLLISASDVHKSL